MSRFSDDFRTELKKGFLDAVGSMADYRIRLDAGGWVDKNVLTEEDYLEICKAVDAQYTVPESPVVETETILDETETEVESTETEIIEDSTNEEETIEQTEEVVEETE